MGRSGWGGQIKMGWMSPLENLPVRTSLNLALAFSVLLHALILFVPRHAPPSEASPAARLQARLAERSSMPPLASRPKLESNGARVAKKVVALDKAQRRSSRQPAPQWSVTEKESMNSFLRELESESKPSPNLAQRSLAMAREFGREPLRPADDTGEMLERLPNTPPVDPFSLEMYLDSLVKKLNRSAGFVRNDLRSAGVKTAAVQIRLNPDGSLLSFKVLKAADQQDEIAFIKSVVEQAVPFSAFPADLRKSAKSLNMIICIRPKSAGNGGFGFSRDPDGRGC